MLQFSSNREVSAPLQREDDGASPRLRGLATKAASTTPARELGRVIGGSVKLDQTRC